MGDAEVTSKGRKTARYTVTCRCGKEMRVRPRHIGRMCRCTRCGNPIYVTFDNVRPRLDPYDKKLPRMFGEQDVPYYWKKGDLLMELYEVRDEVDSGGMATVYRIRHRGWDVDLAVKFPKPELIPDEGWMQTFERECTTWIDLPPHPHVVECHYVRRLGGVPRVFMEYVPSTNLSRLVRDQTFYSGDKSENFARILDVLIQFAWGIRHAHECGVIHQDVKPPNVLVMDDYTAKVTDFGLAQRLPGSEGTQYELNPKYPRGGTPIYRAPEQEHRGEVTPQTDMWGFGLSVLELFAGGIFWDHGTEAPESLDRFRSEGAYFDFLPPMADELFVLLDRCFQEDRTLRPQTMDEIAGVLVRLYERGTGQAYPRVRPETRTHSLESRNNRAVSFLDLDKTRRSEHIWQEILDEEPGFYPALYNRDLFLWRRGRITDAQMVERTMEHADAAPADTRRQYLLARVLLERGEVSRAMDILQPLYRGGEAERDVAFAYAMAQSLEEREHRRAHTARIGQDLNALALSADARFAFLGLADGQIGRVTLEPEIGSDVIGKHPGPVTALALAETEAHVLTGAADGTIGYWDCEGKRPVFTRDTKSGAILAVAISASGRHGATVDQSGKLRLLDLRNGKTIRSIAAHAGEATAVLFSRCGAYLMSGGSDGRVKLWDAWTGNQEASLDTSGERVRGIALSIDRAIAVAASSRFVESWRLADSSVVAHFSAHQEEIRTLSVTPDLRHAMTSTGSGTSKLWNLLTGQCLRSMRLHGPTALTRDGDTAAGVANRHVLEVWRVQLDSPPFNAPYYVCRQSDGRPMSELSE